MNQLPPVTFHHTDTFQDTLNKAWFIKEWARDNLVEVAKPLACQRHFGWSDEDTALIAIASLIESRCDYFDRLLKLHQNSTQFIFQEDL